MESVRAIAKRHGAVVIEDACHALGASWKDSRGAVHRVGSCSHSDMTVFSFHPVKAITTCEGGAVTTNDKRLYERLKRLRTHGVTKDEAEFVLPSDGPWYYEMQEPGFNYRMADVNAALGISQIKKLERFVSRRAEIAALYSAMFSRHQFVRTQWEGEGRSSAWHLYPVRIPFEELGASKADWFSMMRSIGIYPQVHYIPVHLQPYYRRAFGYRPGDFRKAEAMYAEEVSLPIYPGLTDEERGPSSRVGLDTRVRECGKGRYKAARRDVIELCFRRGGTGDDAGICLQKVLSRVRRLGGALRIEERQQARMPGLLRQPRREG